MPVEYNKMTYVVELLHTGKFVTKQQDFILVMVDQQTFNPNDLRTITDELLVTTSFVMHKVKGGKVGEAVRRFYQDGTPEQCCYHVFARFCAAVEQMRAVSGRRTLQSDLVV